MPVVEEQQQGGQETQGSAEPSRGWKQSLRSDLQGSPLIKNYDDSPDGLNKAFESYSNLEKLLGQDVVLPQAAKWKGKKLDSMHFERKAKKITRFYDTQKFSIEGDLFCKFMGLWMGDG